MRNGRRGVVRSFVTTLGSFSRMGEGQDEGDEIDGEALKSVQRLSRLIASGMIKSPSP